LNALFFVALLLYLIPAAFGLGSSPEHRRRFQLAAIVTLGTAIAIAVVASVIWYTDYAQGHLGRFDPNTGNASEWPSPGGVNSGPYGIAVVKDVLWYSESGVSPNTLVRFDPKTEKFQTWEIPSGGGVVRNMMATQDGNLVLACSGVDRIALVDLQ
jgi:streptogramin lyase